MSEVPQSRRRFLAGLALAPVAFLVAACGRRGPLQRPGKKADEDDKKDGDEAEKKDAD